MSQERAESKFIIEELCNVILINIIVAGCHVMNNNNNNNGGGSTSTNINTISGGGGLHSWYSLEDQYQDPTSILEELKSDAPHLVPVLRKALEDLKRSLKHKTTAKRVIITMLPDEFTDDAAAAAAEKKQSESVAKEESSRAATKEKRGEKGKTDAIVNRHTLCNSCSKRLIASAGVGPSVYSVPLTGGITCVPGTNTMPLPGTWLAQLIALRSTYMLCCCPACIQTALRYQGPAMFLY